MHASARRATSSRLTASLTRRRLSTASKDHVTLPVLRLPAVVFPHHPVSLPVLELSPHQRPLAGVLSPAVADELARSRNVAPDETRDEHCQLALLADGARTGVIAHFPRKSVGSVPGTLLHVVGGQRVTLLETAQRTAAGARLARFAVLEDEPLRAVEDTKALATEAGLACALLEERSGPFVQPDDWELQLCTLEASATILPPGAEPSTHPDFARASQVPQAGLELSFWLACRLPLSTSLRLHLLECNCPLQRLRDLVDVLRLLNNPARDCAPTRSGSLQGAKLQIVHHLEEPTAPWSNGHASLALPRRVVDVAPAGAVGLRGGPC